MAHDGDEVVITGLAGCFPGSDNVDELRNNLFDKVDLVSEENCRWNKNSEPWP
jgi:fatty acid synthase, animal type